MGYTKQTLKTPDGRNRIYYLYEPPLRARAVSAPLVVFLHGGGGSAEGALGWQGFEAEADRRGWLVAYPQGTKSWWNPWGGNTWNGGGCCGYASDNLVDDVGFIDKMLMDILNWYKSDPARMFITGFSNGGIMAYRSVFEIGKFRAMAAIAGVACSVLGKPSFPVKVMHIHGTADLYEPYLGGTGAVSPFAFPSVQMNNITVLSSLGLSDCIPQQRTIGKSVSVSRYSNPANQVSNQNIFDFWKVNGGGHTWPGGQVKMGWWAGPVNNDFSATTEIWRFFDEA